MSNPSRTPLSSDPSVLFTVKGRDGRISGKQREEVSRRQTLPTDQQAAVDAVHQRDPTRLQRREAAECERGAERMLLLQIGYHEECV